MAKTFDWSIKNGAICICFFVKWQILLGVTLQAYKSSTFPQQHHTLKSSTVWILSIIVCWRTHQKNTTITEKNPQKYNRSWKIFVFRRHYLSSRAAEVDKISKIWPKLIIQTQNVAHVVLFLDRVTSGYPGLMQMHADHFSADPFWSNEFVRLRTKGLSETVYYGPLNLPTVSPLTFAATGTVLTENKKIAATSIPVTITSQLLCPKIKQFCVSLETESQSSELVK